MADRIDSTNAPRYLAAFADGELDAGQGLAVLQYLSGHPDAAARVEAELKFRQAVGRSMAEVPGPSQGLRESLTWLEVSDEAAPATATATAVPENGDEAAPLRLVPAAADAAPARRRLIIPTWPLAAAASVAFLAVGITVGRFVLTPPPQVAVNPKPPTTDPTAPVPVRFITEATRTHVDCSRYPALHVGSWPKPLSNLGEPLKKYLGRPVPYPDLSPIGYKYLGSGECARPMERAAHLLYENVKKPGETVSLFVQDYDGPPPIDEGKVYRGADADAAFPMIIWRHGNMIFYLVGDAEKEVEDAARTIGVKVPV